MRIDSALQAPFHKTRDDTNLHYWGKVCLAVAAAKVVVAIGVYFTVGPPSDFHSAAPPFVYALLVLTFGLTAGMLCLSAHQNERAFYLGIALLLTSCSFARPLLGGGQEGLELITSRVRPDFFLSYFFWVFALRFPTSRIFEPRSRIGVFFKQVSLLAGTALTLCFVGFLLVLIGDPDSASWVVPWESSFRNIGWTVLLVLQISALGLMLRRTRMAPLSERRRVRLFLGALVIGTLPIALAVTAEALIPTFRDYIRVPDNRSGGAILIYSSIALIPLITAYSVLVHRILDVRLIVRKALQYAFARYTLAVVTALPVVGLLGFVYQHRSRPINELLRGAEALILIAIACAGLITVSSRRKLVDLLDRRFFREQYDARRILAGVVERIRSAESIEAIGEILYTQIQTALRPEATDTFISQPSTRLFTPLYSNIEPLSFSSDLAVLIANSKTTLDLDLEDAYSLAQDLSPEDRQWVATAGIQLIVPIQASAERVHGFIALGRRRNDLPYTTEDRLLLSTIANSTAMALEAGLASLSKASERRPGDEQAVLCPKCMILFPETTPSCTLCRGTVQETNVPYVLLDKFRLERKVGAGGMGVVYQATDLTLKRTVAIKSLPTISAEHAIQLRREARAMASVTHPNLATIFGAETWRGQPLLIVEYMTDGTLADRLSRGALPPIQAIPIGIQLAKVLDHLHAADILHRDIKPSNIGFVQRDVPKLLDFGLAQLLHDRQMVRVGRERNFEDTRKTMEVSTERTATDYKPILAGTPAYMSPEVVRGEDPDPSFDLWALAMVIYESLGSHNPMIRATVGETLRAVADARVPDIRERVPLCPPSLAEFLATALSSDIRKRPGSAQEFEKRLEFVRRAI